jgi:ABC-type ATPase involved in cell division
MTIKARDARRITAEEMKYMRRTAGYTWTDHKTNTEFAKELNITPILDKIQDYKKNQIQHVNQILCNRLPRLTKTTPQKANGTKEGL